MTYSHTSISTARPSLTGIVLMLVVTLLATLIPAQPAEAIGSQVTETIVGPGSGRIWKVHRDGIEQGSEWRELGFDDSSWEDTQMKFYESHGTVVGNGYYAYYFREEFEITNVHQISELHLDLYYDDAVVLYLNGVEVYRSIRNNLPSLETIPKGGVIPVETLVSVGGAEDYYVQIPADYNYCEKGCINDGAVEAVEAALLEEGTNVFAAMAWTRPKSDLGFDLGIDVVRDLNAPLPDQLVINEMVTANSYFVDEDGDTPDWFEIYNPEAFPVDLTGWSIEDSGNRWFFPPVTIEPESELLVFASGKDRAAVGSPLHTNFKLSREGDSLRLIDEEQLVRDEWNDLPRQIVDVAYGRALESDEITYLAAPTPGASNAYASSELPPVLRPFSNRLYNLGDPVDLQIDAFDPDGDALTYSFANNQGITAGPDGALTGTATQVGEFQYRIDVADVTGRTTSQTVRFTVVEPAAAATPLMLNEYNAVPPHRELTGGIDQRFGGALGNGGDWYEFVVTDDLLDLRGWTIQLWDRDRADAMMDRAASLTFGDDFMLAALPAGTIITISEDQPDDLSFDPASGDWTLNFQANSDTPGAMFATQENFNSTRSDQQVEIRDADGVLQSPIVGETETWDAFVGGVSGGEVMNLCTNPSVGSLVDPVADYRDNAVTSTFGVENQCNYTDENGNVVVFSQNFAALRASAGVRGDVNCDARVDILDSLLISQFTVGTRTDGGTCPLPNPATQINATNANFDVAGGVSIIDALLIARCTVGIDGQDIC